MSRPQPFGVVHLDDAILVCDKPSGLLVAADRYDHLAPRLDLLAEERFGRLFAVHRIDRDTSGLVIYARTPDAHRHLSLQFEERKVTKLYRAIIHGRLGEAPRPHGTPWAGPPGDREHAHQPAYTHGAPWAGPTGDRGDAPQPFHTHGASWAGPTSDREDAPQPAYAHGTPWAGLAGDRGEAQAGAADVTLPPTVTVDVPLLPDGDRLHRTTVNRERGKPSRTVLQELAVWGRFSLLEARIETGRTHQIRAHLRHLGLQVLCDPLYGDGRPLLLSAFKRSWRGDPLEERPLLARLALHAAHLALRHPVTGEEVAFEAPLPRDMAATVKQLAGVYG
jgi:23S rRNA-/tRNA-specific pseudouridylate synthase